MKVILTEDVRGTGKKGDKVTVKDGYGGTSRTERACGLRPGRQREET